MPAPSPSAQPHAPTLNLEQQKKRARELLDAARAHDPEAIVRIRAHHPRFASGDATAVHVLRLSDAQLVVAREHGFASWPRLKAHIDASHGTRFTRPTSADLEYYEGRARGLAATLHDGAALTIAQVRNWHPRFAHASDAEILSAPFGVDDARLVYAREHGFESWSTFATHIRSLAKNNRREPFLAAVEHTRAHHWSAVADVIQRHPEIATARGTNGNTLLDLLPSVASERGRADGRLDVVRFLLAAGADVDAPNDRGWTPLHQAAYSNDAALVTLLLTASARVDLDAHGLGGTPLAAALFWGHHETAALLAERGVAPANLRIAAALGRLDLVRESFDVSGMLTDSARAARGFYRPHSGFPAWTPSDDAREIVDEAFTWAARNGQTEAMALLMTHGARIDADPYRGTALIWAAATDRVDVARWLLDQGASVNRRATFGGPRHGEQVTALHVAAQSGSLALLQLLVERGADLDARDAIFHGTPADWAAHGGPDVNRRYLETTDL